MLPETIRVFGGEEIPIDANPFRVGRGVPAKGTLFAAIARGFRAADRDDGLDGEQNLSLPEKDDNVYVSKDHFSIVFENGQYFLVDNGSSLGTIVEGRLIGGKRAGGRTLLRHNDVIVVGSHRSGYIFKFVVRQRVVGA
jgi:pSer/pThr/pTyr-binding forkhead associated (FHA) protein